MRIRTLLSSSALMLTLVASGAPLNQAHAQKGTHLAPSTQWAVSKVAGNSAADSYCALAKRFKESTVLTVAKNQSSETSFALDFQRPQFNTAQSFNVVLDPGAGQQRAFEVRPVSEKAFVIRMGQDEPFFEALARTGYLRAEMGDKVYSFDLADIDAGQFKLDSCIASMIMPAAGDEEPGAVAAAPIDDNSYRQEINALRREVQQLKEQNQRISTTIEGGAPTAQSEEATSQLANQIAELQAQNDTLRKQLNETQSNNLTTIRAQQNESQQALEELRTENQSLKAQLQTQPQAGVDTAELKMLQEQVEKLKVDNQRLKDVADLANQSVGAENPEQGQALQQLSQENARLQSELEAQSKAAQELEAFKAKAAALEQENQGLKTSLETAASAVDDGALDESRAQVQALRDENRRLQNVLEEKTRESAMVSELETQIEALKAENLELSQNLESGNLETANENTALIETLRGQIDDLKTTAEEKDRQIVELSALSVELQDLKKANEELQQKLQQGASDQENVAALKSRADKLEATNAALESELDKLRVAQVSANDGNVENAAELEALRAENENLKAEIAAQKTSGEERIAQLQAELDDEREANIDLLEQIEELNANSASPSGELQAALEENKVLRNRVDELTGQVAELEALRAKVEELEAQKSAPQALVQAEPVDDGRIASLNTEIQSLKTENETLKSRIEETGNQDEAVARISAELDEAIEENRKLAEQLKAAKEKAQIAQAAAPTDAEAQQKIARLEEELRKADAEKHAAMEKMAQDYMRLKSSAAQGASAPAQSGFMNAIATPDEAVQGNVTDAAYDAPEVSHDVSEDPARVMDDLPVIIEAHPASEPHAAVPVAPSVAPQHVGAAPSVSPSVKQVSAANTGQGFEEIFWFDRETGKILDQPDRPEGIVPMAGENVPIAPEESAPASTIASEGQIPVHEAQAEELKMMKAVTVVEDAAPPLMPEALEEPEDVVRDPAPLSTPPSAKSQPSAPPVQMSEQGSPAPSPSVPAEALREAALRQLAASERQQPVPAVIQAPAQQAAPQPVSQETAMAPSDEAADPVLNADGDIKSHNVFNAIRRRETIISPDATSFATEAQLQEEQMIRATRGEEAPLAEPITMRRSEDPFADLKVENDFEGYAATSDGAVTERRAEPAPAVPDVVPEPQQLASLQPQQERHFAAPPVLKAVEKQALPPKVFQPDFSVKSLLSGAQIVSQDQVSVVDKASGPDKVAYQWKSGEVYGSAEQRKLSANMDFEPYVKEYLEKTQKRCDGDFAIVPDSSQEANGMRTDTYEIACVGQGVASSASLLFVKSSDTFIAFAHESSTEHMEQAMDIRDRLLRTISGS